MKKLKITTILLLSALYSFAQPVIQWQNTIGGNWDDWLLSIQQTADSGYVLGGWSMSIISGDKTENNWDITGNTKDYWVVKLDVAGNIQWQNTIGGINDDWLTTVQQTFDGGYILGGYSNSNISGDKTENSNGGNDYWVIKLNALGNIVWQNTIGGSGDEKLHSLQQTTDGGYILGGSSSSDISGDKTENSNGGNDYWVVQLDTAGNIQWQNTIGGNFLDELTFIRQTNDGGFILGGSSRSNISGDKTENNLGLTSTGDYWVLKLDSVGSIQWQNTIGGNEDDALILVLQTNDNGFIVGGSSRSSISGDKTENNLGPVTTEDYWIVKLDSSGSIQWQNTIGGSNIDEFLCLDKTIDGGFILGGRSTSNISGDKIENSVGYDYWVVKVDAHGNILWQNTIGGNQDDMLYSLQTTTDEGYILGGWSGSPISGDKTENGLGNYDYWVVKLSPDTITTTEGVNSIFNSSIFEVSPNPFNTEISITLKNRNSKNLLLTTYNVFGHIVYREVSSLKLTHMQKIDLSLLAKGIYFLEVISDGERAVRKIVKE